MEERKKQILLEKLTEYNKTVNNISKFQLNKREENLFCEIMQQFADEYHSEQLRQCNVSGQLPAFLYEDEGEIRIGYNGDTVVTEEWCKWKEGNLR